MTEQERNSLSFNSKQMFEAQDISKIDWKNLFLFENSPAALLIADFSEIFLEQKKNSSTSKVKLLEKIQVKTVSYELLKLFKASSKEEFIKHISTIFPFDFADKIVEFLRKESIHQEQREIESTAKKFNGEKFDIRIKLQKIAKEHSLFIIAIEDITKLTITKNLLFENTERMQMQFDTMPLAAILTNVNSQIIEWNKSAERIFGYTKEEAIGKTPHELINLPSLKDKIEAIKNELISTEQPYHGVNENVKKDGTIIVCSWYNVLVKDDKGKITGIASMVDDVTSQIKAEELLKKSEKKYKDIFEKSYDAVLILKDSEIVECNEASLKMFELNSKESLIGKHPSSISPTLQDNGKNSFEEAQRYISKAILEGSNRFFWKHKKSNGEVFPAEVTLTKLIDTDDQIMLHSVVRDITALVKKEILEDVLFNISKAALTKSSFEEFSHIIKSELHKVIDTSNFFIAFYNKEKHTFTTPFALNELNQAKEYPAENTLSNYVLKNKKSVMVTKKVIDELVAKGEVKRVGFDSAVWIGVPLKIQEEPIGIIVLQSYSNKNAYTTNDILLLEFVADQISTTIQRKKIDNELQKALQKAQESDKLKSSFLANMSHEIRTPMNGIIGFSEFLLQDDLSRDQLKKYAKIIINSSKQLLSIVNDILDISKIEAGVIHLTNEPTSINKMFTTLYNFYLPITKENNLALHCKKGLQDEESIILIDKTKLHQILTNLMSNSIKFTDEGSIEFGYTKKGSILEFYVKDTGAGIEAVAQEKIFDRFTQSEQHFKKKMKGTGLGLAISKKFVELFGGKI